MNDAAAAAHRRSLGFALHLAAPSMRNAVSGGCSWDGIMPVSPKNDAQGPGLFTLFHHTPSPIQTTARRSKCHWPFSPLVSVEFYSADRRCADVNGWPNLLLVLPPLLIVPRVVGNQYARSCWSSSSRIHSKWIVIIVNHFLNSVCAVNGGAVDGVRTRGDAGIIIVHNFPCIDWRKWAGRS